MQGATNNLYSTKRIMQEQMLNMVRTNRTNTGMNRQTGIAGQSFKKRSLAPKDQQVSKAIPANKNNTPGYKVMPAQKVSWSSR